MSRLSHSIEAKRCRSEPMPYTQAPAVGCVCVFLICSLSTVFRMGTMRERMLMHAELFEGSFCVYTCSTTISVPSARISKSPAREETEVRLKPEVARNRKRSCCEQLTLFRKQTGLLDDSSPNCNSKFFLGSARNLYTSPSSWCLRNFRQLKIPPLRPCLYSATVSESIRAFSRVVTV